MHWLLLLALLSSTTDLKGGGSTSSLNRLAETSLRRQLGQVNGVRVQVSPGRGGRGDFESFDVSLDGFSADRLMGLANQASQNERINDGPSSSGGDTYPVAPRKNFDAGDLGDILGGAGGGKIGGILGDILGGRNRGNSVGRIGRIRLNATNFTFQGTRYNSLSADLGEIRFDWNKALRGNFDIQSVSPGSLALSVSGDQAARLLAPRLPSLRDVRVRFSDGRAFVSAKSDAYGVRVPFEVGARLSVQQNRVVATDFAASVAKLRLPSFVLGELTRGVNPLYDFDPQGRWPLAVNLNTAQSAGNVLAMRGGVQWLGFGNGRRTGEQNDPRNGGSRYPDENFPDSRDRQRSPSDILGDILGRR